MRARGVERRSRRRKHAVTRGRTRQSSDGITFCCPLADRSYREQTHQRRRKTRCENRSGRLPEALRTLQHRARKARKSPPGRSWAIGGVPGAPAGAPRMRRERSRDAPGTPWASQERPKSGPGRSGNALETPRKRSEDARGRARVAERLSRRPRIDFRAFAACRAPGPKCVSIWFLPCETPMERCALRTRRNGAGARKTTRFDPRKRRPGRPGSLRERPRRAAKRSRGAHDSSNAFFLAGGASRGARGSETQAQRGAHGATRPSACIGTFVWKSRGGASRPPRCTG